MTYSLIKTDTHDIQSLMKTYAYYRKPQEMMNKLKLVTGAREKKTSLKILNISTLYKVLNLLGR